MSDEPETPDELDEEHDYTAGDLVVTLECQEGRVSVAVPADCDPGLVGRLLDMAVNAIGQLRTQMQ